MRCITIVDVETHMTRLFLIPIFVLFGVLACMNRAADGFCPFAPQSATKNGIEGRPDLEQLDESTRLIVDTVRKSNPETATEQAEAMRTMMDLEQYGEALHYLGLLDAQQLDTVGLFELNQAMGTDFFVRLSLTAEMAPTGKLFADNVLRSSTEASLSPERISRLIDKLDHENQAVRSDAFRALRRLGEPAVAQMVSLFADESQNEHFRGVRAALQKIGKVGLNPLIAGAVAGNENVRLESVVALAELKDPLAFDAIVAAFYSKNSSEKLKGVAYTVFEERFNYFPDVSTVSETWHRRATQMLEDPNESGARMLGFPVAMETLWRWDVEQNGLVLREIDRIVARRIRAADRAEVLAEINPQGSEFYLFNLLTQLESQKQLAGASGRVDVKSFLEKYPQPNGKRINKVLEDALERNLVAAAIGCCEVLEELGDESLLFSGDHRPCPLVQATLYGDRHLQYAALRAIATIDPKRNYAGSSYVLEAAIYSADYVERPSVLVGSTREDLARSLASSMSPSGLAGLTANNGNDFFRQAMASANIRFLLVCDTLHRPDYSELVQKLRQHWKTKRTPIAILYRAENQMRALRIAREDPLTIAMPFTLNTELVALQVEQLEGASTAWPVSNDHRRDHSDFAIEWLVRMSESLEDYSYYDLTSHQDELGKLIFSVGWENSASKILSGLGTPQSQKILLDFASELSLPVDKRMMAANGFAKSVSANGLLLTRSEIMKQYDRYNASEKDTVKSQQVLGALLDAIESNRGR